ncbi:hypothetical protein, partial [Nonomuraea cypriaca]|uniref:hypothetical protein n=1 Tax=Nonomuraea cypriaca TaxID=1187855 RepID=UPI001A9C33C7
MNYIGVTTRCCGPTVEACDHERKLDGAIDLKSLISPRTSPALGVSPSTQRARPLLPPSENAPEVTPRRTVNKPQNDTEH